MTKKLCKLSVLTLIIFVAITISFAGVNMKEGKYEITSKIDMPGMPVAMPPSTYTQCITKEDMVPKGKQAGQNCEILDVKVTGNTVTWVMKCTDANGTTTGNGTMTYNGDSFTGVINMKINNPGQPEMTMINDMVGKRIGNCD